MKTNNKIYLIAIVLLVAIACLTGYPLEASVVMMALPVFVIAGKDLKSLEEREADVLERLEELQGFSEKENRALNEDESKEWNDLHKELKDLSPAIENMRSMEEAKARRAGKKLAIKKKEKEDQDVRNFSFLKVIRSQIPDLQEPLDGLEKEMVDEGREEMRNAGIQTKGIIIPSKVLNAGEKRNMLAGTANVGQELVPQVKGSFIDMLFADLVLDSLGVKRMTGLSGTFEIPRETSSVSGAWRGEGVAASESTPGLEDVTMEPHKYTAWTRFSRDLLIQSSIDIENYVQDRLRKAVSLEVDRVGINGSGSGSEPLGILNTSGIGAPETQADGQEITRDLVAQLIKEVKIDDAHKGTLGFLTNPKVETDMMLAKLDSGSGRFLLENAGDPLLGYRYLTTTQCPSNLTKGNGSGLSALIFGNFAAMSIGQWGGIELIVNPYSEDTVSKVRVSIHSWWDLLIEHAAYFSALKGIINI